MYWKTSFEKVFINYFENLFFFGNLKMVSSYFKVNTIHRSI